MKHNKIWASMHPFYETGSILGRKVANRSFIQALLTADPFDEYHFFLSVPDNCTYLEAQLKKEFPEIWRQKRFLLRLHRELPAAVSTTDYHCFHLSDVFVMFSELIRIRNAYSRKIFSVTAPTHSLSYTEYGHRFLNHLWSGVTGRDAIIATSAAGEQVVGGMYRVLRQNYGLDSEKFVAPKIRRIPLGVDPEAMPAPDKREKLAEKARSKHKIFEDTVFLVFARISYQSKMDLLPLLRAFKRAEKLGLAPGSYRLVLAGWVDDGDTFDKDIQNFASNLGISCTVSARPTYDERRELYALADVFISPSDNLQETFGLTILEAAISSLPVIASDFNGYRDLVVPGKTGLLIPTLGPCSVPSTDKLCAVVPASEYHIYMAQQCVVELEPLAAALHLLGTDREMREQMGQAARERVLKNYTWQKVIDEHVSLWDELARVPISEQELANLRQMSHPANPFYMDIFSGYYTRQVSDAETGLRKVQWSKTGEAVYRGNDFPVIYSLLDARIDLELLKRMLFFARKPILFSELLAEFSLQNEMNDPDFLLLWALKHDFIEFVE